MSGGLRFKLANLASESKSVTRVARKLLEEKQILDYWYSPIEDAQAALESFRWVVSEDDPITTKRTKEYHGGGKCGEHDVFGTVSFVWEGQLVTQASGKRQPKKGTKPSYFVLTGNASVKMEIKKADTEECCARWMFEIGDASHPGPRFHVGFSSESPPEAFPKWLPVPRLPALLLTPGDAIDFLLGELFQSEWAGLLSRGGAACDVWFGRQRARLSSLLEWKRDQLKDGGPPWLSIKSAPPNPELFSS